jgi:D-3-phosphoglycerate dehydrogenase / 2-oxoglutarate reductase
VTTAFREEPDPSASTEPTRPDVAFLDASWLHEHAIEVLRGAGKRSRLASDDPELRPLRRCQGAPVVVTNAVPLTAQDFALDGPVGLIIRSGAGADIVDVPAATDAGIWVSNIPDYCAEEVADHTLLLLLAASRRLVRLDLWRELGRWNVREVLPPIHRIRDRRLGIVGFGRVGSRVAGRAIAFGWQVGAFDPLVQPASMAAVGVQSLDLDELFGWADAITLHCPLAPTTRHLVDRARLAQVRPGLILVNASRGALVDLDALDEALRSGVVGAAALDVLDGEPRPDLGHPVLHRDDVLITPHVAWYSVESRRDLGSAIASEALRFLRGEKPLYALNPDARRAAHTERDLE